jgi:hypothetical protein
LLNIQKECNDINKQKIKGDDRKQGFKCERRSFAKQATFVLWNIGVSVSRKGLFPQLRGINGEIREDCVPGK